MIFEILYFVEYRVQLYDFFVQLTSFRALVASYEQLEHELGGTVISSKRALHFTNPPDELPIATEEEWFQWDIESPTDGHRLTQIRGIYTLGFSVVPCSSVVSTYPRDINLLLATLEKKSFESSGEIRNLNYPNLRQGVWLIKKTTQTTIPLRRTQRDRSTEVR